MMAVVLLTRDLTVLSRVEGAAARAGTKVLAAGDVGQAVARCVSETASCLIVDLTTPELNVAALLEELGGAVGERPRIVAFGPHVHAERLAAAREAGCDEVVSRGEFFARVDVLVGPC